MSGDNRILENTGTMQNVNINLGDSGRQTLSSQLQQDSAKETEDNELQKKSVTYQRTALIITGIIALAAVITIVLKVLKII